MNGERQGRHETRSRHRAVLAIGALAGLVGAGVSWFANREPEGPEHPWTTRAELAEFADLPGADERLQDAADALEESPLYVDPALSYLLPPDERDDIVDALESGPPTFVVVAPVVKTDGMGGNRDAAVIALSDEVGLDGYYAVIDQDRRLSSVDRDGDALAWHDRVVPEGSFASALERMFHEDRTQWIPEETDVD
ncbi:hypothetical protein EF847_18660 [Actinobacteria bacterium YIM 96077]|uniref:Uncharacterized protein n=1 Tax=Phytoactinopolyspora halophila TaxID=1981511 RepID=A0A329QHJ7_9ACTN|nr:hypothetical protein [Phytoactinopolyspora halophila]AYY14412.1 hypothetical protein EF847_18660 [Actinobacteria bacterium YIM 96077]RAW11867.1 hypothetical protein DPM12_15460 [Phytoactinopolyspora halophila]